MGHKFSQEAQPIFSNSQATDVDSLLGVLGPGEKEKK